MLPISVDITIITIENIIELTEINVALCSDGIISLSIISVRTSIKSSKKEPVQAAHHLILQVEASPVKRIVPRLKPPL